MEADILIIKALVASRKGGMPLASLSREYRSMEGKNLNFCKYGFSSLEDMIRSCKELKISFTYEGPVISVHDEKMSHVTDLVSRQRAHKKKKGFNRCFPPAHRNRPSINYGMKGRYPLYKAPSQPVRYSTPQTYRPVNRPVNAPQRDNVFSKSSEPQHHNKDSVDSWSDSSSDSAVAEMKRPLQSVIVKVSNGPVKVSNGPESQKRQVQLTADKMDKPTISSQLPKPKKNTTKSNIPFYKRTSCSFGAGDVRYANTEKKDILVSAMQNLNISNVSAGNLQEPSCKAKNDNVPHSSLKKDSSQDSVKKTVEKCATHVENHFSNMTSISPQDEYTCMKFEESDEDESPPLMGIGRGRLRQALVTTPGGCTGFDLKQQIKLSVKKPAESSSIYSDDAIPVGDDSSTRKASFQSGKGLTVTFTSSTADSSRFDDGPDDWDEFEPSICNYQMISDDVGLRIAEVAMDCSIKKSGGIKSCGLCIEGLTIEDCCQVIEETDSISEQVLVVLGMSDILLGFSFNEMKEHTENLLKLLKARNILPIVVTIPIIPCLKKFPKQYNTLNKFNKWLLHLQKGLRYFWVMDITQCLQGANNEPFLPFFEKMPGQVAEQLSKTGAKALYEAICGNMV